MGEYEKSDPGARASLNMEKNNKLLWDEFLKAWPLERVRTMTLSDYTDTKRDDAFIYWLEFRLAPLGSIRGGSAFKFGVFARGDTNDKEATGGRAYTDDYGWYEKFGSSPEVAFENVKANVLTVIDASQRGALEEVDVVELSEMFKWKLAFQYQNIDSPTILPIFYVPALQALTQLSKKTPISQMHKKLLEDKPENIGIVEYGRQLWNRYTEMVRIWKVSHGKESFSTEERHECLGQNVIRVHSTTLKGQGNKFKDDAQIGDYFYLCHGNDDGVQLFGRIESDPMPVSYRGNSGWLDRKYKVISKSISKDKYRGANKGWAPLSNSTFKIVPKSERNLFNQDISIPFFGKPVKQLIEEASELAIDETDDIKIDDLEKENDMRMKPTNTILYGPPGTGKTYNSINHAVALCRGVPVESVIAEDAANHDSVRAEYDALREQGRIAFCTFHQSMSYEDFVEGIKPRLGEDGQVGYELVDGIFKSICDVASSRTVIEFPQSVDLEGRRIWKMSLGNTQIVEDDDIYHECIENKCILLGYGFDVDYSGCDSTADIKSKQVDKYTESNSSPYHVTSVNIFKNKMKTGDIVIISDGNHKFRAIAEITGEYEFLADSDREEFRQKRSVKWLRQFSSSLPKERLLKSAFSQMTLYELKDHVIDRSKLGEILTPDPGSTRKSVKPYVLVIDEINRGNVSAILGELITLLEPDRRAWPLARYDKPSGS